MGWRLQDTNYYDDHNKSNNSRSAEFHLDGKVNKITVNRSFCIKDYVTDKDKYRPAWPPGKYCIYKVGAHCPQGLIKGYVLWTDDEDWLLSMNEHGGTLPEGRYDHYAEIHFCCRTDGENNDPILLPSKSPFFLLAYNSSKCQMVKWAIASVEWIYYFTNDYDNGDQRGGAYPYNAGKMHPTIYYCYYQGCNETLTAESGTFLSPNYPRKYPDGQYCSWRITVNNVHKIHLIFSTFSLQTEQNTDELYVYDGENEEGEVLGVFYGGLPPPSEGIYSRSNTMFLIFKSDKSDSYTGFSASYYVVDNSSPSVSTTLQISEVLPSSAVTSLPEVMSSFIGTSTTIPTSKVTTSSIVKAIRWPAGAYGIPKPASGCPWADGLEWRMGWRLQDTNYHADDNKSNYSRSAEFHLDGEVNKITANRSFCIKDDLPDKDKYRPAWPPGKYCIYKVDAHCPQGLIKGYVFWHDDEDWLLNMNERGGTLPEGRYYHYTEIHFCCRTDGDKNDPILLPSKSPFFLLAYNSSKCQMVKWAIASVEWIYYFTNDYDNGDQRGGAYPYNAGKMHPTIYYCYYQGCNETLTAESGTFLSPNYPRKYPDGQYCSWRITVNYVHKIHLIFSTFSLQTEQNTDELYVYDGDNAEGEILGVFHGGHPPPREGIYSSSNTMFLIFKSDKNDSYAGFSASYYAVDNSCFNVVAVIVPVVSVVLTSVLIAVFFYWRRKRINGVARPNDAFYMRLRSGSTASDENMTL